MEELRNRILLASRRRAVKLYRHRPFDSEYLEINLLVTVLKPVLSAVSFVTGFVYLNDKFRSQNVQESLLIAVSLLLVLEGLKYFLTPKMMNKFFRKRMIEFTVLAAFCVPLYLTSVFISVNGVCIYFDSSREVGVEIKSENRKIIVDFKAFVNENIKLEQDKYQEFYKQAKTNNTLKWKTTTEQLERIEKRIDELTSYRDKEVELMREELKVELNNNEIDTTERVKVIRYVSLITEFLLFAAFAFGQYYLHRSYLGNLEFRKHKKFKNSF